MDIDRLSVEASFSYFAASLSSQIINSLYRGHYLPYLLYLLGKALLLLSFLLAVAYVKRQNHPSELSIISCLVVTALWI